MVTITNYFVREGKDGNSFITLELTGDIEMVQSLKNGKFYATAKKCTITSTFPEVVAKTFIGKLLKGRIERVECEPYEYKAPGATETLILGHTYAYYPKDSPQSADETRIPVEA